jgi:hypothetical protein
VELMTCYYNGISFIQSIPFIPFWSTRLPRSISNGLCSQPGSWSLSRSFLLFGPLLQQVSARLFLVYLSFVAPGDSSPGLASLLHSDLYVECPINFHCLLFIAVATGSSFASFHKFSFVTTVGQRCEGLFLNIY